MRPDSAALASDCTIGFRTNREAPIISSTRAEPTGSQIDYESAILVRIRSALRGFTSSGDELERLCDKLMKT
jgi:hypothetical protein